MGRVAEGIDLGRGWRRWDGVKGLREERGWEVSGEAWGRGAEGGN